MPNRNPQLASTNVNVTLKERLVKPGKNIAGQKFPCPTCGVGLSIRYSRSEKPYCVCMDCGNQLFFRGKPGIRRLTELVESGKLITQVDANAYSPAVLFNRLVQLRSQRTKLKEKRRFIICDPDLENAIRAVDNGIKRVQGELSRLANAQSGRNQK